MNTYIINLIIWSNSVILCYSWNYISRCALYVHLNETWGHSTQIEYVHQYENWGHSTQKHPTGGGLRRIGLTPPPVGRKWKKRKKKEEKKGKRREKRKVIASSMCTYMATQIPIRMSYWLCNYVFRCENVKLYTNAAYMARFVNLHIIGVVYGMFF